MSEQLREPVLKNCFVRFNGTLARGGQEANNRVEINRIERLLDLKHEVILAIGDKALEICPNPSESFVAGVPSGGTWLADGLGKQLGYYPVHLKWETPDKQGVTFKEDIDKIIYEGLPEGLLIEDVFRTLGSTRIVLSIIQKARAALGVLDRGYGSDREELAIPHWAAIEEFIDPVLPVDSPLWEYTIDD